LQKGFMSIEYLTSKGWKIFPCNGKTPATRNGFKDATNNKVILKQLFNNKNYNIGLPTGVVNGITVLDVDPRHGGHIAIQVFDLPDTPYVKTAGGGYHYYFKYDKRVKTGANVIGAGLDIRNDGGYVITPPSKGYYWCDEDLPLAEAPEWLLTNKFEQETKKFELPKILPKGQQDDLLYRYACSMYQQHLTPEMIRAALKQVIEDYNKCPQDNKKPFTDKDIDRWIGGALKHELREKKVYDPIIYLSPVTAREFKKKEIQPLEFYVDGIIQKKGSTMISAKSNTGKSMFLIDMLVAICRGEDRFLDKFDISNDRPRVLYMDLEMGEAAVQSRLEKMGELTDLDNLYIQTFYGWDILNQTYQTVLQDTIENLGINIVAFDPLGSLWFGDENKRETVKQVTDYMDLLKNEYGVSIVLTHHWRKATKDFKAGGEMAAGSYGWSKWLDNHVTLSGETNSLVVSCEKIRNQQKWVQIRIELQENMCFSSLGEFKNIKKYSDEDLLGLFNSFNKMVVKKNELIQKAEKNNLCSGTTVRRLLDSSKYLRVDKTNKPHIIMRKEVQTDMSIIEDD